MSEVKSELIEQRNLIQKVTERVRKIEPTSASHSSGGFIEVTQVKIIFFLIFSITNIF